MKTKKKVLRWKRAVSQLLALALILTAVPQTSMTALAVGGGTDTSQGIITDADTNPASLEDGDDNGTDNAVIGQTGDENGTEDDYGNDDSPNDPQGGNDNQPANPDDENQGDGDNQSGNSDDTNQGDGGNQSGSSGDSNQDDGDNQPANPDDVNQSGGMDDTEEPAEPEEGIDDDLLMEDESVSMNDLEADTLGVDEPMAVDEEASAYLGEVETDEDGSSRLVFREWQWDEGDWGSDKEETFEAAVLTALDYYAEQEDRFDRVQIDEQAEDGANRDSDSALTIKEAYINRVISVLLEDGEGGFDYNYSFNDDVNIGFSLWHPYGERGDFTVKYDVELLRNRGVRINLSNTDYPADGLYINWNGAPVPADEFGESDIYNCFWGDGYPLALLSWGGSSPTGIVGTRGLNVEFHEETWDDVDYFCPYIGFSVDAARYPEFGDGFTAGSDYLITNLYYDEKTVPLDETLDREAGLRSGTLGEVPVDECEWKSFNEEIITIEKKEDAAGIATLTGINVGEAFYSVSYKSGDENYLELHSVRAVATVGEGEKKKELKYIGEVVDDVYRDEDGEDNWNGVPYSRLIISEWEAKKYGADISNILTYYAGKEKKFNCVQFEMIDPAKAANRVVKKAYINGALNILKGVVREGSEFDNYRDYWIDYNFRNEDTEASLSLSLNSPYMATADVKATFTLTELTNQGLKVKFASTAFPAQQVSFSYDQKGEWYSASLPFTEGADIRLFKHSSGNPTALVGTEERQGCGWYEVRDEGEGGQRTNLHFENIKPLGTTEYLATSIYGDEWNEDNGGNPVIGVPKELMAGERAGNKVMARELTANGYTYVTWKSFDTDKATIGADKADDNTTKLTAWRENEEIYYYVKYKVDKLQYLEVHGTHAVSQKVRITIDADKVETDEDDNETRTITLKYYTPSTPEEIAQDRKHPEPEDKWLQVRYYPVTADSNDKRLKWEITEGKDEVISFAKDNEGHEVEGNCIVAVGPGEATVKVSYLDGDYDEENDWEFKPKQDDQGREIVLASATCTIIVEQPLMWYDMEDEVDKINQELYAVMDADQTLADVKLSDITDGKWSWAAEDPTKINLTSYKGMGGCQFLAKYMGEDGRTYTTFLWVNFITPTGITMMAKNEAPEGNDPEWSEWYIPSYLVERENITFTYQYTFDGIDMNDPDQQDKIEAIQEKLKDYYANVEWMPPSKESFEEQDDEQVDEHKYIAKILGTGAKRKAEKKTFTVSVKNAKNKVVYKDTRNITVTLESEYDLYSEDSKVGWPYTITDDDGQMWLVIEIRDTTLEEYNDAKNKGKLTVASEDTAVLKLSTKTTDKVINENPGVEYHGKGDGVGDTGGRNTYVKIACTNPKPGMAWIKLTASDEMKTFRRYQIEFPDKVPKAVSPTTVTINKALAREDDRTAVVRVRTHEDYPLITEGDGDNNIKFLVDNKENDADFKVTAKQQPDENIYDITIKLSEGSTLKKGKHTVTLNLYVRDQDEESQEETVKKPDGQIKVTVNVTETVPKVTFKQTKKYNNFYTDEEGYGILTVTTADGTEVKDLELVDPNAKTKCNFTLEPTPEELGENTYYIVLREGEDEEIIDYTKNKKGVLQYRLEGYDGEESELRKANITVSTENKKPTIVLSAKSDTLYPKVYYMSSFIRMTDKATGDNIFNEENENEVRYVITNGKTKSYDNVPIIKKNDDNWNDHEEDYKATLNNSYYLWVDPWGGINNILVEQPDLKDYKTKADKITLEIKKENWKDWVSVPYSITVNTGSPKLVLGVSTVTLNKNSEVYQTQQAMTSLRLKGCQEYVKNDEWNWVRFTGQDDKSKKVLSGDGSLTLEYWNWYDGYYEYQYGDVVVRFNDIDNVTTGTYKFKIEVGMSEAEQAYASTTLTVKVVDTAVNKGLKVTAKGSINVMDKDGTSVTYTPKLSNLSGKVVDGRLIGTDADLFESYWDGSKLVVKARFGENYSTKLSYKVRPVFNVEVQSYGGYEINAGIDLAIKVKQGKPKLTVNMINNTIYRQLNNSAEIRLSAVFNKKPVAINHVELVNYANDFNNWPEFEYRDDDGNGTVKLSLRDRYSPSGTIIKSGTYKVKLRVIYSEKAGNEKAAEVTCSIVVK